jgi:hypothetical protein
MGEEESKDDNWLTSTKLGKIFNVTNRKMNLILDELGWIYKPKHRKGWLPTKHGRNQGGKTKKGDRNAVPYVVWPTSITENKTLVQTFANNIVNQTTTPQSSATDSTEYSDFRKKYPPKYKCMDGHYVRSRAEVMIDNWLYVNGVAHVYEKKLPINEKVYSDFYLRDGKVYIEFWGMESDEKYVRRMQQKIEVYTKNGFSLIELHDSDLEKLGEVLPIKLLKYNISVD